MLIEVHLEDDGNVFFDTEKKKIQTQETESGQSVIGLKVDGRFRIRSANKQFYKPFDYPLEEIHKMKKVYLRLDNINV